MKRTIKIIGFVMILCMLFSVVSFASTGTKSEKITFRTIGIVVNGTEIAPCDVNGTSTEPFIRNADGSTYLPVRAVAGALGLDVGWNDATSTVILKSGGKVLTGNSKPAKTSKEVWANLTYRNIKITLDGKNVTLKNASGGTVEPFIKDGSTYIPVRAVAEALGCEVGWNGDTNTVTLKKGGSSSVDPLEFLDYDSGLHKIYDIDAQDLVIMHAKGGTEPYKYKWEYRTSKSGEWTEFAQSNTVKLGTSSYTEYRCTVTDASGQSVTSDPIIYELIDELRISKGPYNSNVNIGKKFTISVEATGGKSPYSYQWYYRYAGESNWKNLYSLDDEDFGKRSSETLIAEKSVEYYCTVTDAAGDQVSSKTATITVSGDEFLIKTQPAGKVVDNEGDKVTLSVEAVGGTAPYTYQWQYKYSSSDEFTNFSSPDKPSFGKGSSESVFIWRQSYYRCIITDATGKSLTSETAVFWVRPASSELSASISANPQAGTVNKYQSVVLTVSASGGTAPYTYQWQFRYSKTSEFENCFSANDSTDGKTDKLSRSVLSYVEYRCEVTDSKGNVTYTPTVAYSIS